MSFIVISGVIIHVILLYSIFDIYYTSPIVQNAIPYKISSNAAPADRIVVFSADGLRWDTFHDNPELSPFLHSIIDRRQGVFGISRSHVPTESRPGHVAIFAGFSEDVSAVAKGWKKNPVPFDSVFNRSDEAYIWGSPDITTLFDNYAHVSTFSYYENDEDFNSDEAYKLDEWVFQHFESFLTEKQKSEEIGKLGQPRKIFFLHLLGLDTNGHGKKPHSSQYKDNLRVVDTGIEKVVKTFDRLFPDGKTAYLFTSDHGMTDWGSHGGGSDEEILTPLVAWGSGIAKGGAMKIISQVDLAPLMSSLIGTPIPVNSVGVLPIEILSATPIYNFKAAHSNFLQLQEQISILRRDKSRRIWFREYAQFGDHALKALEAEMLKLAKLGRYSMAASLFVDNAASMRQAIFYYHRYDRWLLSICVSATFIGWILLVWISLQGDLASHFTSEKVTPNKFFKILLAAVSLFCWLCNLPWTNFIYVLLPVLIISTTDNLGHITEKTFIFAREIFRNYRNMTFSFLIRPFVGFIFLSVFLFIGVIVFMDRRFLSAVFLMFLAVPNFYPVGQTIEKWTFHWRVLCLLLLPFPFFPSVGRYEVPILCAVSPFATGVLLRKYQIIGAQHNHILQIFCFLTSAVVFSTSYFFLHVPFLIRFFCWLTLPLAILLPVLANTIIWERLILFIVALYIPYSLLSIAYESLFIMLFIPMLLIFLRFEFGHLSDLEFLQLSHETAQLVSHGKISWNEYRRAVMCIAFTFSALFGTGNFASLNAFNPTTLYRFITIFSPFTMAALLIAKLLIPLLIVTLVMASALRFDRIAMERLSYMVLMLTDMMAMDEGSWADIGLSISHYIIAMCMSVAILLLLLLSTNLMTTKLTSALIQKEVVKDCSL